MPVPRSPRSSPRRLRPAPRHQPVPRLIEAVAMLHGLAAARPGSGSGERRRQQQLSIAQRLLDPLPEALHPQDRAGTLFWRALRWGGAGVLIARLLAG